MKRLRLRLPKLTRRRVVALAVLTALGGGTAFAWRVWQTAQPEYHWVTAQAALEAGQPGAAKLELQNLLRAIPTHGLGHRALAQLLLGEARASGRTVTMAEVGPAFDHLLRAAENLPKDLRLQKQALTMLLENGRLREAAEVAERIKTQDSGNPDVLYALTWHAVDGYRLAHAEMTRLSGDARSPFQSLVLQIEFQHTLEHESHVQAALDTALDKASAATVEELFALTAREYESLLKLCRWGVERAPDQAAAEARANHAVATLVRLGSTPPGNDSQRRRLAEAAETADQLLFQLRARYPLALASTGNAMAIVDRIELADEVANQSAAEGASDLCADAPEAASATAATPAAVPDAPPSPPAPASLAEQVEKLRQAAVAAEVAAPLVYYQAAAAAIAQGKEAEGLDILRRGIKASDLLPAARKREVLDLHFLLTRKLIDLGRYAEADESIRVLQNDADARGWAEWLRGMTALKQGRCERAYESFQLARISLGNILPIRWGILNALTALEKFDLAQADLKAIDGHLKGLDADQLRRESTWFSAAEFDYARLRIDLGLNDAASAQADLQRLAGTPLELEAAAVATQFYLRTNRSDDALALLADIRTRRPNELRPAELTIETLLRAGRTAEADRFVAEFAEAEPTELPRQLFRGRWLLTQRKTDELTKLIIELESAYPPSAAQRREISVLKAWNKLQAGDIAGARESVEPLRADPNYATLASAISAAIELREGNRAEAEKLITALRIDSPETASLGLWQARLAAAQGNFASAADSAAAALEITALRKQAGRLLLDVVIGWSQSESPAAPLKKVEELIARLPRETSLVETKEICAALVRADEAFHLGQAEVCLAALDVVAPKLPSESPLVPLWKAKALLKAGAFERAAVEADRALALAPQHAAALVIAAEAQLRLGRFAEALDLATAAQTRRPESLPAALCRAEALRRLNRVSEALLVLQTLPATAPDAMTCLRVAEAFQSCGLLESARTWGRKSHETAVTPELRRRAEMYLGNLALGVGLQKNDAAELTAARDHFAAVFAADPQQEVAGNNLAWLLAERFDRAEEAVRIAEQVRDKRSIERLAPDFIDTLITAYHRAGRLDEAVDTAERAAAVRPKEARLQLQLGTLLAAKGRKDEARRALETALQIGLDPTQTEAAKRELTTLDLTPAATN